MPFLIAIGSFSLILFVENIAFDAHELVHDEGHDHDGPKNDKHALHDKKHLRQVNKSIEILCKISLCQIKEHDHNKNTKDPLLMGYDKKALEDDHDHEHENEHD